MDLKQPELPELPAGIQTFEEVRVRQAVYVDKTKYFPLLPKGRKVVFCARPRRFGKSLTVSALDAFFSGRKDLFQGLTAEKFMNTSEFTPKPVIHLDMSEFDNSRSLEILEGKIRKYLTVISEQYNVALQWDDAASAFSNLLKDVSKATSKKIVLLIDEYDAPVLSLIQRSELTYNRRLVEETRETIRSFYSKIKSNDKILDFVFITGISKFSRMGVFSPLNNLVDISIDSEFAAFMGLTQNELEENFAPHLSATAQKLRVTENELLEQIKDHYDGFSFDGKTRVYNPFSTLLFFEDREFNNYWMESGSNGLIRKFLLDKKLTVEEFSGVRVDKNFARMPGEIGATPPKGFLYQAGYLTLREGSDGSYTLNYPNFEVRTALSALFMDNLYADEELALEARLDLSGYLEKGDIPGLLVIFMRLYSGLSSRDHKDAVSVKMDEDVLTGMALEQAEKRRDVNEPNSAVSFMESLSLKKGENFYRSVLQACLWSVGADVRPEASKNRGQADLEVKYKANNYIIEMKIAKDSPAALKSAQAGLTQIRSNNYGGASKKPILISLAVDLEARNIGACVFEKNGQTSVLDSQDLLRLRELPTEEAD
ncbi:MAG: ATP-binding protein [Deltaproteobacteria bacterium]|jgi:hypothetical protein|nr:ATP-binding protein [Deltaproteobacteria bacterium]